MEELTNEEGRAKVQSEANNSNEARREGVAKKKRDFEKMDVVLEEIMKEPNIDKKIMELEVQVKVAEKDEQIKVGKAEEVKADAKERDENGQAKFDEYKRGVEKDANKSKSEKAKLAKKLKFYKAFKEHKNEIFNLREVHLGLQKELEKLEMQRKSIKTAKKGIEAIESESEEIEKELQELLEQRREVDLKLNNKGLSDYDIIETEIEKNEIIKKIDKNQEKYKLNAEKRKGITNVDEKEADRIAGEIKSTEVAISKVSTAWRCLLKGKSWDEIDMILANGDFTAEKGTINKIRDLSKYANENKKTRKVKLEDVQRPTEKNASDVIENGASSREEDNDSGLKNPPTEYTKFEDEHPKLAKIPFLAKFINDRREKKFDAMKEEYEAKVAAEAKKNPKQENKTTIENEQKNKDKDKAETRTEKQSERAIKDIKYIRKQMDNGRGNEMVKGIAKYGIRETVKADEETKLRIAKVEAAHAEAEKHGGKYIEQAKNAEEKAGREPGDE